MGPSRGFVCAHRKGHLGSSGGSPELVQKLIWGNPGRHVVPSQETTWAHPGCHSGSSGRSYGLIQRVIRDHSGRHSGSFWGSFGVTWGSKLKTRRKKVRKRSFNRIPNSIHFYNFQRLYGCGRVYHQSEQTPHLMATARARME